MMSSGSFDSDTLLEPRIRMRWLPPVVPLDDCTVTPGERAVSSCDTLVTLAISMSATLMLPTVLPTSRRRCVSPLAVTIRPSSAMAVSLSAMSAVTVCPATTFTVASPGHSPA
jgi:hypothetical protein